LITAAPFSGGHLPRLEARHWIAAGMVAFALALVAAALLWRSGGIAVASPAQAGQPQLVALSGELPPTPEPLEFRPVAPQDAVAINTATPVSTLPNPAARPFEYAGLAAGRAQALDCLTAAVYYEAAVESADGQRAVAQVVLNRARHPAYPNSVCGVVYQGSERRTGCQFTFTCDGSLARMPSPAGWARARAVAEDALSGYVYAPVGWATHYHANYVVPYWSSSLTKLAAVGTHVFYRWEGSWGTPRAFTSRYAAVEPAIMQVGDLASGIREPALDLAAILSVNEVLSDPALAAALAAAGDGAAPPSFGAAVLRAPGPAQTGAAAPVATAAVAPASAPAPPAAPAAYRSALLRQRPEAPRPQAEAPPAAPAGETIASR